jgi:hypothetical protein
MLRRIHDSDNSPSIYILTMTFNASGMVIDRVVGCSRKS